MNEESNVRNQPLKLNVSLFIVFVFGFLVLTSCSNNDDHISPVKSKENVKTESKTLLVSDKAPVIDPNARFHGGPFTTSSTEATMYPQVKLSESGLISRPTGKQETK